MALSKQTQGKIEMIVVARKTGLDSRYDVFYCSDKEKLNYIVNELDFYEAFEVDSTEAFEMYKKGKFNDMSSDFLYETEDEFIDYLSAYETNIGEAK